MTGPSAANGRRLLLWEFFGIFAALQKAVRLCANNGRQRAGRREARRHLN